MLLLLSLKTSNSFAQTPNNNNLTPDGLFDTVFDSDGNQYALSDLRINNPNNSVSNRQGVLIACNPTSIFNLYFEPGCGMSSATNPVEINRRTVLCQVFQDISDFLTTSTSPIVVNNTKINILVRDLNLYSGSILSLPAVGQAFYAMPQSLNLGGIIDNEIWKTIQTGRDSWINVTSPFPNSGYPSGIAGLFYHGSIAFNFNTTGSLPTFDWYTTPLNNVAPVGKFDMYTIALREIVHMLGFKSLIDQFGTSFFKSRGNYFSRYDRFLNNSAGTAPLLINTSIPVNSSMYNYYFNTALSPTILRPNCSNTTTFSIGTLSNNTICSQALRYVGSTNTPIYTPTCFERNFSFSHFEDQCVPPNLNDGLFVMSNSQLSTAPNNTKRYLKAAERSVLCDLGYKVNNSFGNSGVKLTATQSGPFSYGSSSSCSGITVAGTNDGFNFINGTYTFLGGTNTNIPINCSTLMANDTFPAGGGGTPGIEFLHDLTTNLPLLTSGTSSTIAVLNTSIDGIHLLRYVPTYGSQKGNITYVFVYVFNSTSCAQSSICNLVSNGNFEQFTSPSISVGASYYINNACGWNAANNSTTDYFNSGAPFSTVPCNLGGYQIPNGSIGNGYAGIYTDINATNTEFTQAENMYTKLTNPLVAGSKYQLSFDVSLGEKYANRGYNLQAYLSPTLLLPIAGIGYILPANNITSTLIDPIVHTNCNTWDTVTFNYTAIGGEQYLYLGNLQPTQMIAISPNCTTAPASCLTNLIGSNTNVQRSYYYIDNVKLVKASLDLPATVCINASYIHLPSLLSAGTPTNGVFTGTGVVFTSGLYFFNPGGAGVGVKTITYTYNNGSCNIQLIRSIKVLPAGSTPIFVPFPPVCYGGSSPLPQYSNNGISGTWTPAFNNTASGNYTFTPSTGGCNYPVNVAVQVLSNTAFVANNDSFPVTFWQTTAPVTTSSVLLNDTYNSGAIPITIPGIPYSIVLTGTPLTIPAGAITFNATAGTFTVLANTTPGTYTYSYYLQNNCYSTAIKTISIIVNKLTGESKKQFTFCYNNNSTSNSASINGGTNLYQGIKINGVQTSASNSIISLVAPTLTLPSGVLSLNAANGTVTIAVGTLPGTIEVFYQICSNGSCATPLLCQIIINNTFFVTDDNTTATLAPNGLVNYNVLSNDTYVGTCGNPVYLPATLSNVTITNVVNDLPYYSINPATGQINNPSTGNITSGTHYLSYTICDNLFPTICASANVLISVPVSRMSGINPKAIDSLFDIDKTILSPNPADYFTRLTFNDVVNTDCNLELYDIFGRLIFKTIVPKNSLQFEMDLNNYSSASYFLKLYDASSYKAFNKIIIRK